MGTTRQNTDEVKFVGWLQHGQKLSNDMTSPASLLITPPMFACSM
jgi:hypothetical protein